MDNNCIFCKIINRTVPADFVAETNDVIAIKDISPKSELHLLIIPKKHIENVVAFQDEDFDLASSMFRMAVLLSQKFDNAKDFKLLVNNGKKAGQVIFHTHMHFLAGENL